MKIYLFTYKGYHPNEETEKEVINRIKLKKNLYKNDDFVFAKYSPKEKKYLLIKLLSEHTNIDKKQHHQEMMYRLGNEAIEIWKELEI